MKTRLLVIIIVGFLSTNVFGQVTDSLGLDNNISLNRQEVLFLNTSLANSRDTFDFANKKIAFVTGNSGQRHISKQHYFLSIVKPWIDENRVPQIFFVRLTNEEKQKSGGYDAIVLSWVKHSPKRRKKA